VQAGRICGIISTCIMGAIIGIYVIIFGFAMVMGAISAAA